MKAKQRWRYAWGVALAITLLLLGSSSWAVGTAANTDITNTASVSATVGGLLVTVASNPEVVTVAELLDVNVTRLTPGNVLVNSPASNQVLAFRVTNLGNGVDDYTLQGLGVLNGFTPAFSDIFLDADGDGLLNTGIDTLYVPGGNDPILDANNPAADDIVVFLRMDIPAALATGDLGDAQLAAISNGVPGAPVAPGTVFALGGDGGTVDAIAGPSGGTDQDLGTYQVSVIAISVTKTSVVVDPFGGTQPVPGATITYTLTVTVTGVGTANNVLVTDSIPGNTTYVFSSMTLNGGGLTDASDSPTDEADFNITNASAITVGLGNVVAGGAADVVTFDVVIN